MVCKEGIFPVAGLKVTDSTWQIIKTKTSNHQHRTTRRTIGLIQRRPLSHFESEYFTFGKIDRIIDQRQKKRANHMNIFVFTFLGWYQYQGFTLFLGAAKRN